MFDINITIVNYNTKEDVERCLVSVLSEIANSNLIVNVTVIDNASSDNIVGMLYQKFPTVRCMANFENMGFGKAHNYGIKSNAAKYHFILNPDTRIGEGQNALRRLYDFMEANPKIGLVGPKLVYPDGSLQYSCYRFPSFWHPIISRTKYGEWSWLKKHHDKALMKDFNHDETIPVDWVMGSAMFARADALERVGLFDEQFWMYYEDSDLCRRLWEAGWPIYYVHDVVVEHAHGRGSAKVAGTVMALIKNKLARVHLLSWLKYMWKWRGNHKYYV